MCDFFSLLLYSWLLCSFVRSLKKSTREVVEAEQQQQLTQKDSKLASQPFFPNLAHQALPMLPRECQPPRRGYCRRHAAAAGALGERDITCF